ncbi:hypothetical protein COW95_04585 [Candidatus Peregrinibacteria bacterium CG22_combo_CG10-13_8_21_14_all_49_11]|nr:MAG: hypothetical protein COW95_04585 [Candidatus Peregrinibacteria bacterium CG22_combo_CG10-13_8_21_14_all_49_11]
MLGCMNLGMYHIVHNQTMPVLEFLDHPVLGNLLRDPWTSFVLGQATLFLLFLIIQARAARYKSKLAQEGDRNISLLEERVQLDAELTEAKEKQVHFEYLAASLRRADSLPHVLAEEVVALSVKYQKLQTERNELRDRCQLLKVANAELAQLESRLLEYWDNDDEEESLSQLAMQIAVLNERLKTHVSRDLYEELQREHYKLLGQHEEMAKRVRLPEAKPLADPDTLPGGDEDVPLQHIDH